MPTISQGAINAAFNLAVARYERGDRQGAMNILRVLTLLAPKDSGVWRALARCHDDAGETELAEGLRWLGSELAEMQS